MWGSKKDNEYSDQIYRDRNAGGFETKGKCCCFYLSKTFVVIFLTAFIAAAGAASVLSIVLGYKERWVYVVDRSVNPPFNMRTGWLYYSNTRGEDKVKLDSLAQASYILGIIGLCMNGLSALLALYAALRATCGRLGRGFICFSVIFSILLIGTMLAFYVVTAVNVYKYEQRTIRTGKYPWPDWAWGLGAGSALFWLISAGITSAMPKKSKYFADEAEFRRQRADPNRPYQIPPPVAPPAQGTPVNGYVPSSVDGPSSTRNIPPMASQENTDHGVSPKKSFMPSWAKRGSYNSNEPKPAGGASVKDRADEIRDRYRNQNRDLEMGGYSERPKTAW